jgi:hypothetical protein
MGSNFHTPYADSTTLFKASSMNPALASLDQAITYEKNTIVSCDGEITWGPVTGQLTWTGTIRILFIRSDGKTIQNTIAAGSLTVNDNYFAYIDLNETDGTALTMLAALISTGAASNFKAYNCLVLGYRNAGSDEFYPVLLRPKWNDPDKLVQVLTPADNVTVNWRLGSTAEILLNRANTHFTFSGGRDGQRLVLVCKQDATGGRTVTFAAGIRGGTDVTIPPTLSVAGNETDYLGFIYRNADGDYYDMMSLARGYGPGAS